MFIGPFQELEALRKNMQFEIDRLTAALADAEARMKVRYQFLEFDPLEVRVDPLELP